MAGKTKEPPKPIAEKLLEKANGVMESFHDAVGTRVGSRQNDKNKDQKTSTANMPSTKNKQGDWPKKDKE